MDGRCCSGVDVVIAVEVVVVVVEVYVVDVDVVVVCLLFSVDPISFVWTRAIPRECVISNGHRFESKECVMLLRESAMRSHREREVERRPCHRI